MTGWEVFWTVVVVFGLLFIGWSIGALQFVDGGWNGN